MKHTSKFLAITGLALGLLGYGGWIKAELITPEADAVKLGRSLYRGSQAFSAPVKLAQVALPAASSACANCHGLRGEGKSEAGIQVPPLQWRRLMTARDGQPGFANAATIVHAIEMGKGRKQQNLLAPMPQFALSKQEQAALLAYLRVIGTESEPVAGVSAEAIIIGSVLPLSGRRATAGRAIQTALEARLAEVNHNGGIFGRQILLKVADAGEGSESAVQAALGLMHEGVFALLGSLAPDAQNELAALARNQNVPFVGTLGLPFKDSPDVYLTYLLPSLAMQTRQLLTELPQYCGAGAISAGTLVLYTAEPRLSELAQQVRAVEVAGEVSLQIVANSLQIQEALKAHPSDTVIALLPPNLAATLRQHWAERKSTGQCLGTLAALSGHPANSTSVQSLKLEAKQKHIELIVLPMSPLIQPENAPPLTEAQLWPLLADIATQTFVEALARTGRVLDTPSFIQALGTLRTYVTESGLSVSFSEKQHHGLNVAYLWKEDDHEPAKLSP
ncbi:MAG: ABC transporter substrate-binding protein [Methylotenera sp.]